MKKLASCFFIALLLCTLAACGGGGGNTKGGKKEVTIAYSIEQLTEGLTLGVDQMNAAIEEFNNSQTEIFVNPVEVYSADYELANQLAAIEDVVVKQYDILLIQALDNEAVLPYLKEAADSGVTVIDAQGDLKGDGYLINIIACDHYSQGQLLKETVKKQLEENPDLMLNVGIVWHDQAVTACLPRMQGIKELGTEMPDRVKILAEIYTSETAVAQATMEDWLQTYPDMNYVSCSFDEPALGVINAIKSAGIAPGVIGVASIDGSQTGCELLAEGYITNLVGISPREIAGIRIEAILEAVKGNLKPGDTFKGSFMVMLDDYTKEQIDQYLVDEGWVS